MINKIIYRVSETTAAICQSRTEQLQSANKLSLVQPNSVGAYNATMETAGKQWLSP